MYKSINDFSVIEDDINKVIYINDIIDFCCVMILMNKIFWGEFVKMIVIGGLNLVGGGIKNYRCLYY